jgi:hypothetical protein
MPASYAFVAACINAVFGIPAVADTPIVVAVSDIARAPYVASVPAVVVVPFIAGIHAVTRSLHISKNLCRLF